MSLLRRIAQSRIPPARFEAIRRAAEEELIAREIHVDDDPEQLMGVIRALLPDIMERMGLQADATLFNVLAARLTEYFGGRG
jgi:hypothetical protein